MKFKIAATDGHARRGVIEFDRGNIDTPAFMPVGTLGSVRSVDPDEVRGTEPGILATQ